SGSSLRCSCAGVPAGAPHGMPGARPPPKRRALIAPMMASRPAVSELQRSRRCRLALLDRGALAPHSDLHPAALALLGLGDPDLEHAVLELGANPLGVDALGQGQRAREAPRGPLDPVVALLAVLLLGPARPGNRQDVVLELDLDVLLAEPGQVSV